MAATRTDSFATERAERTAQAQAWLEKTLAQFHANRHGDEIFEIANLRETGSNSSPQPMPVPINLEARKHLRSSLNSASHYFFGGGSHCVRMSRKFQEYKVALSVPDGISWDAIVTIVSYRMWSGSFACGEKGLLSAWAYFMACPRQALYG